jgi:hypothetical protein
MAKRYFKIVIMEPLNVPLTRTDHLSAPSHYLKIEEYQERIIEVDFLLLPSTDPYKFEQLIHKSIKLNYKNIHSITECFKPDESKIEQNNEFYAEAKSPE